MNKKLLSAKEILLAKGSYAYFLTYCLLAVIATCFQVVSKVNLRGILAPLLLNLAGLSIAFIIYIRKNKGHRATALSWILGLITVSIPFLAKYNYGINVDWTFALESTNTSILIVIFVVMLQMLYNKRLFIFYTIFAAFNWVLFFYIAYLNGAIIHIQAMDGDKPIHGVVLLREIFFIIIFIVIAYIAYRNIPVIDEYDEKTSRQRALIEKQAEAQKEIVLQISEKMGNLLVQVEEQNKLTDQFNQKMQSQASTFEEISATLEELLGSAENISITSVEQVDGNVKMENIVNEFKNIKVETRSNLDATLQDVEGVAASTTLANEQIQTVENTIAKIKEQSSIIGDTVSVIVDIADRINLLSLNASIEAARAGESGKGFAVVAEEIGKLAVKTTDSIKEIEKVLKLSSETTATGVEVIRSTADMVRGLIGKMSSSSGKIKVLQESIFVEEKYINVIIEQMFMNIDLAKSIGRGTDEQKYAIESTTKAIEHVNEILGEMVGEVQELAWTSNTILNNATELVEKSKEPA